MKRKIIVGCSILFCLYSVTCHAGLTSILRMIRNNSGQLLNIQTQMLNGQNAIVNMQHELLKSQQDIGTLMRQVNGDLSGNSGWGTYQFHDYQSYGEGARDWSRVIDMAAKGQGTGALGQMINSLASQFPSDNAVFNRGISNPNHQKYYALKSQTVLATRAASQLDYNKINDQILYQQMLQQQIEKTKDLKSATDLSNRIQVEGNLINLEILRQSALANQQQAVTEQASISSALVNARFLTKE